MKFNRNYFSLDNDNNEPKVWYKIEQYNDTAHEVEIGMDNNDSLNRVSLSLNHSLIIKNIMEEDAGIYYCQIIDDDENYFNYIVDGNKTMSAL